MKNLNKYIAIYKRQLEGHDIQSAYAALMKYVMSLKSHFAVSNSHVFTVGNVSPGYMDFTYFPFFNDFLRKRKLRFGIVLNHKKVRFELWLMGQNREIQAQYWNLLKTTKWNEKQETMPKYSVLEEVLVENPDFNDLDILTEKIIREATRFSSEVIEYIKDSEFK